MPCCAKKKRPAEDFIDLESYKEFKKSKITSDDIWLHKHKLTIKDKQIIENNLWLNDKHMEAAQNILKSQYSAKG